MAVAIHHLGATFLRLSARGGGGVPGRRQVLVHVRLSEFYDRFDKISVYSPMIFFRFHLGQLSLPQALPGIVSLVASHLDAERRQLCEGRLLRFSLQAAAETATSGSDLELLLDIGTFRSPQAEHLQLMAHWMLETPLEVAVEEDISDYYYYPEEDSDGFGGIPAITTFIENLESSPYGRGEGIRETQCMICLENFDVEAEVSKMPCSHTFHNQCIVHWLGESNVCPICRNKMPTSGC